MGAKKGGKKAAPAAGAKKGAAAPKKKVTSKRDAYEVSGDKVTRKKPTCPKCGPGVFMATHGDRKSCGKCGYTEFKKQ
jgi:small subunit ribosomal protein S27Ae